MSSRLHKFFVPLLYLIFLTPNIFVTIWPREDWPFTNAPMFADYVDKNTPRYRFKLEAIGTETKELGFYSVGANWSLWRYFFKHVYSGGEAEIKKFLGIFFAEYQKRHPEAARSVSELKLSQAQLSWDDNSDLNSKPIVSLTVGAR